VGTYTGRSAHSGGPSVSRYRGAGCQYGKHWYAIDTVRALSLPKTCREQRGPRPVRVEPTPSRGLLFRAAHRLPMYAARHRADHAGAEAHQSGRVDYAINWRSPDPGCSPDELKRNPRRIPVPYQPDRMAACRVRESRSAASWCRTSLEGRSARQPGARRCLPRAGPADYVGCGALRPA
jgi:hypothetical protein